MHKSFPDEATYKNWVPAIWARADELGLNEDDVRMIAEQVSGKPSVSAMSMDQFRAWHRRVDEMYGKRERGRGDRARGQSPCGDSPQRKKGKIERIKFMASPEQIGYIRSFARNEVGYKKYWNERGTECESISIIIRKKKWGRKQYIDELTIPEARSVIETLKSIRKRKRAEAR